MKNKQFEIIDGVLIKYNGHALHVEIPNSVTYIGTYAFHNCYNLVSIEIPNSVNRIGCSAFRDCIALTNIEIPNSVTYIGQSAFYGCKNLTRINIPNSVTEICAMAFANCTSLNSIKISNCVSHIGGSIFLGCISLNNIEIPNSVKYIGSCAFNDIKLVKPQYKSNGALRAFKAFSKIWTCKYYFQYAVGQSYHQDGEIKCCRNGFHACPTPLSVFNYYSGYLKSLRFAEVELSGEIDWKEDKVAASDIKIIREVSASELVEIYNSMEKV